MRQPYDTITRYETEIALRCIIGCMMHLRENRTVILLRSLCENRIVIDAQRVRHYSSNDRK